MLLQDGECWSRDVINGTRRVMGSASFSLLSCSRSRSRSPTEKKPLSPEELDALLGTPSSGSSSQRVVAEEEEDLLDDVDMDALDEAVEELEELLFQVRSQDWVSGARCCRALSLVRSTFR